eukprot:3512299-Rhodomonas_salina.1
MAINTCLYVHKHLLNCTDIDSGLSLQERQAWRQGTRRWADPRTAEGEVQTPARFVCFGVPRRPQ